MGAWIEIFLFIEEMLICLVAPFVGAWIEILDQLRRLFPFKVAPFVGAWIEIATIPSTREQTLGRSLRGSVD